MSDIKPGRCLWYLNFSCDASTEAEEGGYALSFKDYGQEIKNPEKAMEYYYREYEYKNGLGIGISIVKSIIDEADITLNV